jgi:Family of unknown function (DUF5330)
LTKTRLKGRAAAFLFFGLTALAYPAHVVLEYPNMLFLLRLAFWIMLICLLLPGSREDNRRLISSAEQTVSDVRGFCQRNPQVCEDVRITMTSLLSRLKAGAEMIQTWLAKAENNDDARVGSSPSQLATPSARTETFPDPQGGAQTPYRPVMKWQDSLNPVDRQVTWRGPGGM